jgi:hypothetical protein
LRRWNSTVVTLTKSDSAISRLFRPPAASWAMRSSLGSALRFRSPCGAEGRAPVARSSSTARTQWHLGLTEGASDETKARYGFVFGDFRRIHRSGIIACHYRAAEWRHKEVELTAHELLQLIDRTSS